jgi:2-methylaconitate isomerase
MASDPADPTQHACDVPAVWMRGGSCKGLFFLSRDLPRVPTARDLLLLRLMGSPDRFQSQIDGLGGASASTSKVVVMWPSLRDDADLDFMVGHIDGAGAQIDWSRNCEHLTAAVACFAIDQGMLKTQEGMTKVRLWQSQLGQSIDAHVPVQQGKALESGAFEEPGVAFTGSEIRLEFFALPEQALLSGHHGGFLPTGRVQDSFEVDGIGVVQASLVCVEEALVVVKAQSLGLTGRELPADLLRLRKIPALLERLRAMAAARMGFVAHEADAALLSPLYPKLVWVAPPVPYKSDCGEAISSEAMDLSARILVKGKLLSDLPGPSAVALAACAALPGSVTHEIARTLPGVPTRIGHPTGVLTIGAQVRETLGGWRFEKTVLSHSARKLMSGRVHAPSRWAVESMASRANQGLRADQ